MSNAIAQIREQPGSAVFADIQAFEHAQRMVAPLVSSSMVPKQFQGRDNIGNAMIALEMSQRLGASPLMVMQNLYVVHGTPAWSAKFLIATFNQCGRFSAIRYRWKGSAGQSDRACQAYATELATSEEVSGPWIDWKLVKSEGWDSKGGSKWQTMPEKMFMYRAAAWMVDLVAPEISMGLQTVEQVQDIIDIDPSTGEVLQQAEGEVIHSSRTSSVASKLAEAAGAIEPAATDPMTGADVTGDIPPEVDGGAGPDPAALLRSLAETVDPDMVEQIEADASDMDGRRKGVQELREAIATKKAELGMEG